MACYFLYFAKIKDIIGLNKEEVLLSEIKEINYFNQSLEGDNSKKSIESNEVLTDYKTIFSLILKKHADKKDLLEAALSNCLIAINDEYVFKEVLIKDKSEVSLIPPISGG